jgi:hypothetical protein
MPVSSFSCEQIDAYGQIHINLMGDVNRKLKSSNIQVNRKAEFKQAINTRYK